MSKKTKPEVEDDIDLDAVDDTEDLDLDEAEEDPDQDEAEPPRLTKKSDTASKKATKSTSRRGGKSRPSQSAFTSGGKRPAKSGGGSGRKGGGRGHIAPVKVASDRPWGTIALFALVGALFVGVVGYTGYLAYINDLTPAQRATRIDGVKDYTKSVKGVGDHKTEDLTYPQKPPVGGTHHPVWQNCQGNVYDAPIADEHAVHSLEHGTVWITYQPDLPKDQVEKLAERVRGKDFTMLSPYQGQSSKISVQAWGYQLQVDDADDSRIDDFIAALRNEGPEKGVSCAEGITVPGDKPRDVQPPQPPQQPGQPGQPGAPAPQPG